MLSACIKMIVQCVQRSLYDGELEKFVTGSLRPLNTELLVFSVISVYIKSINQSIIINVPHAICITLGQTVL